MRIGSSVVSAFFLSAISALAADGVELFETKIRPVFAENCYACHTKSKIAGLRMDSREDLLKGGEHGPAIVPGDPDKSLLIQAIRHDKELKMPKGGKLKPAEIQAVVEWVKMGAPWPEAKAARPAQETFQITPEQRRFWSFQPLKKSPPMKDMENEIASFQARKSFAYAVLTPDGSKELGCVYLRRHPNRATTPSDPCGSRKNNSKRASKPYF